MKTHRCCLLAAVLSTAVLAVALPSCLLAAPSDLPTAAEAADGVAAQKQIVVTASGYAETTWKRRLSI